VIRDCLNIEYDIEDDLDNEVEYMNTNENTKHKKEGVVNINTDYLNQKNEPSDFDGDEILSSLNNHNLKN
jgi:hypothetical protein